MSEGEEEKKISCSFCERIKGDKTLDGKIFLIKSQDNGIAICQDCIFSCLEQLLNRKHITPLRDLIEDKPTV